MELIEDELSYKIRAAVFEVSRHLGAGFLEKVYERALMIELESSGLGCKTQSPIGVNYKGILVGEYFADILVENRIILEIKAQQSIKTEHTAQLINYLKATDLKLGFLINFTHPKAEIKRFVT
jgi:GxxExxY protein